jgi:hypothetical protein
MDTSKDAPGRPAGFVNSRYQIQLQHREPGLEGHLSNILAQLEQLKSELKGMSDVPQPLQTDRPRLPGAVTTGLPPALAACTIANAPPQSGVTQLLSNELKGFAGPNPLRLLSFNYALVGYRVPFSVRNSTRLL